MYVVVKSVLNVSSLRGTLSDISVLVEVYVNENDGDCKIYF